MTMQRSLFGLLTIALLTATSAMADTIYVNNIVGADYFDGSTPDVTDSTGGPVRTFNRATQLVRRGGSISIANTGTPYHQSLSLTNSKNSGFGTRPFLVEGNGATLSGASPVPAEAWRDERNGLWRFKPLRKGHYLLFQNGNLVKEQPNVNRLSLMQPAENSWAEINGSIYYQTDDKGIPPRLDFSFARETTGISLYGVRHVLIRDLTLKHFRVDGINAHDLSKDIVLENVTCIENGRSGISVSGTCDVRVRNSTVKDNRRQSIRISELGGATINKSQVNPEPLLVK